LLPGSVRGVVTGGCLSNLTALIGTPYFPKIRNRLLLLEDINERPYRLDRMLWQLMQSGVFFHVKGVLLGEFPGCFLDPGEKALFLQRVTDYLAPFEIPVVYDLPLGHSANNHILPLGVPIELESGIIAGVTVFDKGVME
jgi:muramoyltetrapeptide carboxypeptidase